MSRPLRIEYEGAWYHVMNRGLAHDLIFLMEKHYNIFLDLLSDIHERYGAEIHAYCLMDNHYHLLIRTPLGNISRIMRHLDGVYTQKFNLSVNRDGPIFRGRYKSILIEEDIYLYRLSRYIHLNPVKAGIVRYPQDFPWSSYNYFLSHKKPYWLSTKYTLEYFDNNPEEMKKFTEEGVDDEINQFFKQTKFSPILGSESFIKSLAEKYLKDEHKIGEIPEHKFLICHLNIPRSMEQIIRTVSEKYGSLPTDIMNIKNSRTKKPRAISIYLANRVGQYTFPQISSIFIGTTPSSIAKTCVRLRKKMRNNELLKNEIDELIKMSFVQT